MDGLLPTADPLIVAGALRKAVMARVQRQLGPETPLPSFFSGHRADGTPALQRDGSHLAFAFDPFSRRAFVLAPHTVQRREETTDESARLALLHSAMSGFHELRAGSAGLLTMEVSSTDDRVLAESKTWRSVTPYVVNRHAKKSTAYESLAEDVRREASANGLPMPEVVVREARGIVGLGLAGSLDLSFPEPITGPLLLGRLRHKGGGLFVALEYSGQN